MKLLEDADLHAGEYVLGTLDNQQRVKADARARQEPVFAAAIVVWERRFAPLHELIAPVTPPDILWPQIANRLETVEQHGRTRKPGFVEIVAELSRSHGTDVASLLIERLRRWRIAAIVMGAIAVSAIAYVAAEKLRAPPAPASPLVGVLRSETIAPAFVVVIDVAARTLSVKSVPAILPADRNYRLWLLHGDGAAVALGRVQGPAMLQPAAIARAPRSSLREATIAVSIESASVPADSAPSAPFLFKGKLDIE